jgi:hypothetical protein
VTATIEVKPELVTPPVCLPLWRENPYRLVSLGDLVRQFRADSFVACTAVVSQYWQGLQRGGAFTDVGLDQFAGSLGELSRLSKEHGLVSTFNQTNRIREYLGPGANNAGLIPLLAELLVRIGEDLERELFLAVPNHLAQYYMYDLPIFGTEVANAFPSAYFDIAEAGKCHALHRSTACVFHLMRVLEIGLSSFGKVFNISADHTNWETIINQIEKAIATLDKAPNRPANWKDDREFYSQCASHFRVMKDAWRNYTAHARGKYTEHEASDLIANVRGFMQRLATRLHE